MFLKYFIMLIKRFHKGFCHTTLALFLMAVFASFLELLGIAIVFPLVLLLTNDKIDFPILNLDHFSLAIYLLIAMVVIFIFKNIFMIYFIKFQNSFVKKWSDYVNSTVVKKLFYAPYSDIKQITFGDKLLLLNSNVREISLNFLLRVIVLLANGVVAVSILALLFYKFTIPAFLSTIFILIYAYFENAYFKKKAKVLGERNIVLSSNYGQDINFSLSSIKEIIVSNKRKYFADYLANEYKDVSDNFSKEVFYGNCPLYITEIGVIISFLIMMSAIVLLGDKSESSIIASIAVISLMVLRLVPQLNKVLISMYVINVSKYKVMWFFEILDKMSSFGYEELDFKDKISFNKNIIFKDVTFEHEKDRGVYNLNFEIKKGEFIGIIGLSGAGKTTLADVLAGVYSKQKGSILVDDVEINSSNLVSFQKLISFLPQESSFMQGNILKNVAWGQDESEIDVLRAKEALIKAGLTLDIYSNMNLSSGQKKRVALARAYYNDFEILILDEPTSSLDVESENEVMENVISLKGDKTIIAIAHRLNTLKECDKIIYLKEGKIQDIGDFQYLRTKYSEIEKMLRISSFD